MKKAPTNTKAKGKPFFFVDFQIAAPSKGHKSPAIELWGALKMSRCEIWAANPNGRIPVTYPAGSG
jgi:hypothetical protein